MPEPEPDRPVDVAVGRHPDHGIVATSPSRRPASTWMLRGLGFQPVPDHPHLHKLVDQDHDAADRTVRAVALLRRAGHHVQTDAAFDPEFAPDHVPRSSPAAAPTPVEPDVAVAEHPRLGIIAATADTMGAVDHGGAILESHGWRFNHTLDIYTLPVATSRHEALGKVASAAVAMHQFRLVVAVEPHLAQDVADRHRTPRPTVADLERSEGFTQPRTRPLAAALASTPARPSHPGKAPVPTPAVPTSRPVDPRVAFSRTR